MTERKTGRTSDQFMLRLPDGMRDRIKRAAEISGRSMNAEIVSALEEKYPPQVKLSNQDLLRLFLTSNPEEREVLLEAIKSVSATDDASQLYRKILEDLHNNGNEKLMQSLARTAERIMEADRAFLKSDASKK